MKIKQLLILVCLSLFIPKLIFPQSKRGTIYGQVKDKNNDPVNGAILTIVNSLDSSVVSRGALEQNGAFLVPVANFGSYLIKIDMLGHRQYKSKILVIDEQHTEITLPLIVMESSSINLKEIAITAQKQLVERKIDRTVVNVDALISNSGSNALEVLEKSPGVLVDQNGAISLKGKLGVAVFIDDKPTYLSGEELATYLKSLPSSSLDQIELMPNPPARYDASGNAGVINIKTKKVKIKGFNGGLNLNFGQGNYTRSNNGFNFNYRNNKFNFFGNLSLTTQSNFSDLDIFRRYKNEDGTTNSYLIQNSFSRQKSTAYDSKIGMDYYQSPKTTWGIVFSGLIRPSKNTTQSVSDLENSSRTVDSSVVANILDDSKLKNSSVDLNFRHQFDKEDHEISANVDYLNYNSSRDQTFDNSTYLPSNILSTYDQLFGRLPSDIKIYAAKVDYSHPLGGGYKLAMGAKSSLTETDNTADYFSVVQNIKNIDYDKTNHFTYKENINAVYLNLNKSFDRFSFQAGVRAENTHSNGHQLGNAIKPDSSFKRNYTNLFPTVYLSYKLDSAAVHQLGLNYGRRIERPYYQDLNPFISPIDKFTYYEGNPFLNPAFSEKIELSYTYNNRVTVSVNYNKTHDDQSETIEIIDGIYYSRPGNIGSTKTKSVSLDGGLDPFKWLNFHIYGEVTNYHAQTEFYTGRLDTKGTYVFLQGMLQFKLQNGWSAQLDGNFQSKRTSVQFVSGSRGRLNTGIAKKLSNSATLKLSVNDILYTYKNRGTINNLALTDATFRSRGDSRWLVLTGVYRFGKAVSDQRRSNNNNGADNEQNRIKN